ncbi:AraC-type DNA-binding protein [Flexibacter flexilis DSM 6793]|uniref:AraC-type DNA-binding protein n=1 Tax=Flexibacter flexilis DSM 6793 TaxID=927664 RepID=A0A1I1FFA3_9BACT|nr:helix-turn-helix domain-containing protein [Flexibacter flexilis]SFB98045.1 AraC-type DNA-binding protein [Flexibacter flexilis DSM 6793]
MENTMPLKIYNSVHPTNENLTFGISRMEDIYDKRNGQPDVPHRHNYYTLLLTRFANGRHLVDFNEYPLQSHCAYFVAPGQVHQVIEHEKSLGYAIVFSASFLAHNNIPIDFIENLNLFRDFGETPPLTLSETDMAITQHYANEMYQIHHQPHFKFRSEALGALIKLLLVRCHNACSLDLPTQQHSGGNTIFQNFKNLVNEHYSQWHTTQQYAAQLFITPDYLNRLVKNQTGKTAKDYIQSRIIVAAKHLLYFTELSNKEIAYQLGFSEPANFSAFFKNATGVAPSAFKRENIGF